MCGPCWTLGSGIGKRTAFAEHIENGKIRARGSRHGGTHTLGAEFRTVVKP
jgi:hypothetical protein